MMVIESYNDFMRLREEAAASSETWSATDDTEVYYKLLNRQRKYS